MRICENGIYRDATEQEIAERNIDLPSVEAVITSEERIEALEAALLELMGVVLNG